MTKIALLVAILLSAMFAFPVPVRADPATPGTTPSAAGPFAAGNDAGASQIGTREGKSATPVIVNLTTAPSGYGGAGIASMWKGDMSHVPFALEYNISGADTLTKPYRGYVIHAETAPFNLGIQNSSGWDSREGQRKGRTGTAGIWVHALQAGGGDLVPFYCTGAVRSERVAATYWAGSPAVTCYAAQEDAVATDGYLNLSELDCNDKGFDAVCNGQVLNLLRTNDTAAHGDPWMGSRVQSVGTVPIDAGFSLAGRGSIVFDGADANFVGSKMISSDQVTSGGTNYASGDPFHLSSPSAVCSQLPRGTLGAVRGGAIQNGALIFTSSGKCTSVTNTFDIVDDAPGSTGSGGTAALTFDDGVALAMAPDSWIFYNATNSRKYGYPESLIIGKWKSGYSSTNSAYELWANGTKVESATASGVDFPNGATIAANKNGSPPRAGIIGSLLSSALPPASAVSLAVTGAGNIYDVTSIVLPPGDWDCSANLSEKPQGGTITTVFQGGLVSASATLPIYGFYASGSAMGAPLGNGFIADTPFESKGSTTVYLTASANWAVQAPGAYGRIFCREAS